MIKKLFELFAKEPVAGGVRKPRTATINLFRAVAVVTGNPCCEASKVKRNTRILMRSAPALPLAHCSMRQRCTCHYSRYEDRRDSERRALGMDTMSTWFSGKERRLSRGRRSKDR